MKCNMFGLTAQIVLLLSVTLTKHLIRAAAAPIKKLRHDQQAFTKPPSILNIPDKQEDGYVFGDNASNEREKNHQDTARRDEVCESKANNGCRERCISLKQSCRCGSNGKTYRNQCEMSCMRKVEMLTINWSSFGKCQSMCPSDQLSRYKKMVKDFMMTESLKKKVRRCGKLSNCAQAKLVLQYTKGEQTILECSEYLPPFLLFAGLKCLDRATIQLQLVLDNNEVINCDAAKTVSNKLFNDRNCARKKKGLSERELIEWAFELLDTNYDRQLERTELAMLSVIPDQACEETFSSVCDTDQDGFLRGDEWSQCLGCTDCYKPCHVFQAKKKKQDRKRRFINSLVTCNEDGTCAGKQCAKSHNRHEQCWCVDKNCNEIKGTRTYASISCG